MKQNTIKLLLDVGFYRTIFRHTFRLLAFQFVTCTYNSNLIFFKQRLPAYNGIMRCITHSRAYNRTQIERMQRMTSDFMRWILGGDRN